MDSRQALGSWLSGPRAAAEAAGVHFGYRGERLGLPEEGPGSIAGPGRRLGALLVDWIASILVVRLLFPSLVASSTAASFANLGVFVLEVTVLTWLQGASFGHRLLRLQVVRLSGAPVGLPRALLRTALIALVVPALVWDRDSRGLHDKAAGTVLLQR